MEIEDQEQMAQIEYAEEIPKHPFESPILVNGNVYLSLVSSAFVGNSLEQFRVRSQDSPNGTILIDWTNCTSSGEFPAINMNANTFYYLCVMSDVIVDFRRRDALG